MEGISELGSMHVGIIGMGDIGIETAKLLNAFGCRVSYNKRYPLSPSQEKEYNVTYMSADDILKNCDIVSLHIPSNKETFEYMNEERFAMMKKGSILINTARGEVVKNEALLEALKSGQIAATGLDVLAKLAKTYLNISVKQNATALTQAKNVTITAFDGPNPAGNVGVQINHLDPVSKGETVWTIDPQAVIFIGRLFNTGHVDFTRTVAVTGSEVLKPAYCKLQVGALLTNVFAGNVTKDKDLRYISGNVLTGKQVSPNGFLGAFHSQLTVIPEGDDIHEMLGWIMPRFNQFSANHSYFSWLMGKKEYTLDARIKGGERHMIMSGEYDRVFPMDILPEYLIKAIIAGDIDRMEALGIYEVAPEDFALCEFVCSSKMELQRIVRAGLDMLRSEMA